MAASSGTDYRAVRDAIWASSLPALHRLIALRLVEHLPHVAPSVASLAEHTGACKRTVERCLADLVAWGCLLAAKRNGARSHYELTGTWAKGTGPRNQRRTVAGDSQSPAAHSPETSDSQSPQPATRSRPKQTRETDKEAVDGSADTPTTPNPSLSAPDPKDHKPGGAKRDRGGASSRTLMRDDWQPEGSDANRRAEVEARAAGVDQTRELPRFRDHHIAKGTRFANWDAGWRNWLRRSNDYAARTPARTNGPASGPPARRRERSAAEANMECP